MDYSDLALRNRINDILRQRIALGEGVYVGGCGDGGNEYADMVGGVYAGYGTKAGAKKAVATKALNMGYRQFVSNFAKKHKGQYAGTNMIRAAAAEWNKLKGKKSGSKSLKKKSPAKKESSSEKESSS